MGSRVVGRAEIDTRAPFRSVKEAVQLFGERVLVGEIYAHKLKEIQAVSSEKKEGQSKNIGVLTAQLEESKQSLEKAREEAKFMAHCIKSLKEELEQTKRELQRLKAREYHHKQNSMSDFLNDPETEDLKFVENTMITTMREREIMKAQAEEAEELFLKKRNVKFASPPSLTRVIVGKEETLDRPPSVKKTKKKPLLSPLLGWLLSKRKGSQEEEEDK